MIGAVTVASYGFHANGGLGWGTIVTSVAFLGAILALVTGLSLRGKRQAA